MGTFLSGFPSTIWIFCTSVASRLHSRSSSMPDEMSAGDSGGGDPKVSTLTNCISMLLIGTEQCSTWNSPVIGSLSCQTRLSSWPVTLKSGMSSRRGALKLSGVISNLMGCFVSGGAPIGSGSNSIMNSHVSTRSWKNIGRLMRHLIKY